MGAGIDVGGGRGVGGVALVHFSKRVEERECQNMPFEPHLKQRASGYGAGSRDRLKSLLLGAPFSGPVHTRVVIRAACRCRKSAHLPWDFPICPPLLLQPSSAAQAGGLVPFGKTTGENVRDVILSQPLARPKVTITAHFPPRPRQALGDSVYRTSEKKSVNVKFGYERGADRLLHMIWTWFERQLSAARMYH